MLRSISQMYTVGEAIFQILKLNDLHLAIHNSSKARQEKPKAHKNPLSCIPFFKQR